MYNLLVSSLASKILESRSELIYNGREINENEALIAANFILDNSEKVKKMPDEVRRAMIFSTAQLVMRSGEKGLKTLQNILNKDY